MERKKSLGNYEGSYPVLGVSSVDGLLVLFTEHGTGLVLSDDCDTHDYLHYNDGWIMGSFDKYQGSAWPIVAHGGYPRLMQLSPEHTHESIKRRVVLFIDETTGVLLTKLRAEEEADKHFSLYSENWIYCTDEDYWEPYNNNNNNERGYHYEV